MEKVTQTKINQYLRCRNQELVDLNKELADLLLEAQGMYAWNDPMYSKIYNVLLKVDKSS